MVSRLSGAIVAVVVYAAMMYLLLGTCSAAEKPSAVPTFECVGLYWTTAGEGPCEVAFRAKGERTWREGLDLVYDPRDGQWRGSIVGLAPDTEYEVQLTRGEEKASLKTRTWSESFPVGKTTYLDAGEIDSRVTITESGSAKGYHLVTPPPGKKTTVDVRNADDNCIRVDADYVILRGLELKNAGIHAIHIEEGRHHIVVEDCRITFWGRIGGPRTFGNSGGSDSAIYAERGAGNLVLQFNLIENPRGASNDWDTGHPAGPQGISLRNSSGGNVIRYNEILSTEDHGFNDAIGGGSNYSFEGSPNRDSDIYGNIVRSVWDDAIESEGANMNVRIWGNYLHKTYQHIATACTSKGPLYIFRNVFGESRRTHVNSLGGSMIKTGQRAPYGGGRKYIFHNTSIQPGGAHHVFSGHPDPNTVTRNNVFDAPGRLASSREVDVPGDYDYDLFTGMDRGNAQEPNRVRGKPAWVESYYLEFYPAATTTRIEWGRVPFSPGGRDTFHVTDPVMTVPNPVIDSGVRIPNFNDDFAGEGPDLGAFELGRPGIRFGRRARERAWAPWEVR